MKKIVIPFVFIMLLYIPLNAQQWEIDYGDTLSFTQLSHGITDLNGNAILVGGHAPVYPNYHPIAMLIEPNGTHLECDYQNGFEGLMLTDVVQLPNGNYFAAGIASKEAVVVMVFDANLDIVNSKRYEKIETALSLHEGRLLLDDDGTLVMVGTARYTAPYGLFSRPFMYRFNDNADTLRCRYVMAEMPDPEYYLQQFYCHEILKNPQNDGLIFMGVGRNGLPSLICYDYDFNYISNIWMHNDFSLLFTEYSSCCWLSDDDLLVFGTLKPKNDQSRTIGLLDTRLSGGVPRLDTIHGDLSLYHIASGIYHNTAFANDTTIYGSYYSTENMFSGPFNISVCLFDKDMEVLGNYVFVDEEYINYVPCFILPHIDGGCVIVSKYYDGSINHYTPGKIIKMSREDFNPLPCSVNEVLEEAIIASAYPNPAKDELNIDISNLPKYDEHRIQITDALGHICMDRIIRGEGNVLTVGVSSLKPGIYFYTIKNTQNKVLNGRFVKE